MPSTTPTPAGFVSGDDITDAEDLARAIEDNVGSFEFNGESFLRTEDVVAFIRSQTQWRPAPPATVTTTQLRAVLEHSRDVDHAVQGMTGFLGTRGVRVVS